MKFVIAVCLALTIAGCTSNNKESDQAIGPALSKMLYAGEVVFIVHCTSCHQHSKLATAPIITGDKNSLLAVHPFDSLKVEEIANVLTFIRNSFGNRADMITIEDVKNFKNPPAQNK